MHLGYMTAVRNVVSSTKFYATLIFSALRTADHPAPIKEQGPRLVFFPSSGVPRGFKAPKAPATSNALAQIHQPDQKHALCFDL